MNLTFTLVLRLGLLLATLSLSTAVRAQYAYEPVRRIGDLSPVPGASITSLGVLEVSPLGTVAISGADDLNLASGNTNSWLLWNENILHQTEVTTFGGQLVRSMGIWRQRAINATDQLLWRGSTIGGPSFVAVDGSIALLWGQAAGGTTQDYNAFWTTALDDAGNVFVHGLLTGSSSDNEALFVVSGGMDVPLAMGVGGALFNEGDLITTGPLMGQSWGVSSTRIFLGMDCNGPGSLIVRGLLSSGQAVVWKPLGGDYDVLLKTGDPLILPTGATTVDEIEAVRLADNEDWAAVVQRPATATPAADGDALVASFAGSSPIVVAYRGQSVSALVGVPGATIDFIENRIDLNSQGQVVFSTTITSPATFDQASFLYDHATQELTLVAVNNQTADGDPSDLITQITQFSLSEQGVIFVRADRATNNRGFYRLRPSSGDCAGAVGVGLGVTPFSTMGGSTDGPDLAGECTIGPGGETTIHDDTWFRYFPIAFGYLTCTALGFDTSIAAYETDVCPAPVETLLRCDHGDAVGDPGSITFAVVPGNSYLVQVGSGAPGIQGAGDLELSFQPATDLCGVAAAIGLGTVVFDTTGAATDGPNVSSQCSGVTGPVYKDTWFCFTSPDTGDVTVTVDGFDCRIVAYTGCVCPPAIEDVVACDGDSGGSDSATVTFPVGEGQSFLLQVGGAVQGTTGVGNLTVTLDLLPGGFCFRETVVGSTATPSEEPRALALSGDVLAIGAPTAVSSDGRVYLFRRGPTGWAEETTLVGEDNSDFGISLDTDGERLIVGAQCQERTPGSSPDRPGKAHIYRYDNGWILEQVLEPVDLADGDLFGNAYGVAIDGDRAAVAAHQHAGAMGAVYVYERTGTTWSLQEKLLGGGPSQTLGRFVQLQGDTLIARMLTGGGAVVRSYLWNGTQWGLQQTVSPPVGTQPYFGTGLSLGGDVLAVGQPSDDLGVTYVYERVGNSWVFRESLQPVTLQEDDQFGHAVATDGNRLLVGAFFDGLQSGATYLYERDGADFVLRGLMAPLVAANSWFGRDVALSGARAAVAARGAGTVETFTLGSICESQFVRGDANNDGAVDIADSVRVLQRLFDGGDPFDCEAAADSNADESVDLADAVRILNYLFGGGAPLIAPFPVCAASTAGYALPCDQAVCP